ncbi:hypothetical protein DFH05DRAFT_474485 [Lentinula detonsa]|uniref:Uncharacterized protein n=1 Tax=Lentinula detonsa TaxID=2804962 RepID=A0A9W8TTU2_9AGAR|nr:hypothetical protein DFH05DRAFT_474485 [Lentinula detonsa]
MDAITMFTGAEGGNLTLDEILDLPEVKELDLDGAPDAAFLAMFAPSADGGSLSPEVGTSEDYEGLWRALDHFNATGELLDLRPQQEPSDNATNPSADSVSPALVHIIDNCDAPFDEDETTDRLFDDSPNDRPVSVPLEPPLAAENTFTNFQQVSEFQFETNIHDVPNSTHHTNASSSNDSVSDHLHGSMPVAGNQPHGNGPTPNLSSSPSDTPAEPLPITPQNDFLQKAGNVPTDQRITSSISRKEVDVTTAEFRTADKRKRIDSNGLETFTEGCTRSHSTVNQDVAQPNPMWVGASSQPGNTNTQMAISQHQPQIQARPVNIFPPIPSFSMPYLYDRSFNHAQASSAPLAPQQQNYTASVMFPPGQVELYSNIPIQQSADFPHFDEQYDQYPGPTNSTVPAGSARTFSQWPAPHQTSQAVIPQTHFQQASATVPYYGQYAGPTNSTVPLGNTRTSSQWLAPYQTPQADIPSTHFLQAAPELTPMKELQFHFENGSGKRSSENPHKRSQYVKMKKSDVPPFVICHWKDSSSSSDSAVECGRRITYEEREKHYEDYHKLSTSAISGICGWVECGRSFGRSRLAKHFNGQHHPFCRFYCDFCEQGYQEEKARDNHMSNCSSARFRTGTSAASAVAGPSGTSVDDGDLHQNKRRRF